MSTDPPRHEHEHVLVSIHNEHGLDFAEIGRPGPLRLLLHNRTGASYPLSPRPGSDLPPTIRVTFGAELKVELDPHQVRAPGWRVAEVGARALTLVPAGSHGWWLEGDRLSVSLGTVTVDGPPGLALVDVELERFGPRADGREPVGLVLLPAGAAEGVPGVELAAAGPAAGAVETDSGQAGEMGVVVTPRGAARRVNRVELRVAGGERSGTAGGSGDLILSAATAGAPFYRPVATPERAEEIEVSADGWAAERTASAGMPVWRLSGGSGEALVRLANVVSDQPAGEAHLTLYSTAPGASGWAVVPVTLVEASVMIKSFTANVQTLNNLNAPAPVLLSWEVSNATTVTLSGVGKVETTFKNYPVNVEQTTTFVLTAFDASLANVTSASVTVVVKPGLTSRIVPAGTILVWSGALNAVPASWTLCNGTLGTPDLRDRFVMGAGGQNPGTSGGPDTHTHGVPALYKSFPTDKRGEHEHKFPADWHPALLKKGDHFSGIFTTPYKPFTSETTTNLAGSHEHSVPVSFNAFDTGVNSPGVRPPWFALAYIMKLPYSS